VRPAAAVMVAFVAGGLTSLARSVSAQEGIFAGMQKGVEFTSSSVQTTTTFASGLVTHTNTQDLFPRLTLNIDALVYPSLRLNTGGVFEVNLQNTTIDSLETDSTLINSRPFFLLRSTNPVLSPGFGYFRQEDRARTAGLSNVKLVNDEYAAYLGWNPAGGPRSDFQFLRTHTFDGTKEIQDVTRGFGTVVSNYTYRNFGAYYQGSYLDTSDRIHGLDTRQTIHGARLSDSGSFIHKRLVWNGTYNINHQDVSSTATGGTGDVDVPVIAFAGLSGNSDLPETARLAQNPLLIDGNLTASAGIDIGLVSTPADPQARNIGLDFLNPAEVSRFLIWIDRDLPVEVSNSYSWQIYSSADNITWRRETIVSAAPFGPFDRRFEILFSPVTARYLKVVVRPLSVSVPNSSQFADIFVTEMQAFLRRPAGQGTIDVTQTTHVVNADVRMRLLDKAGLFYEGYFLYNGPDSFGRSTRTLSNGVSASHTFAGIVSAYGRAAREQGTEPRGDRVATVTNGTLTIDPIPTFRSSLLYSGQDQRVAGLPDTRRGFFVQNSAQVYRGVNALFGVGWNFTTRETGEIVHDRLVNASATVVPRQHISFTFSYDRTKSELSGTSVGPPQSDAERLYAAIAFDPLRSLHLSLGEERLSATGQQPRTTHDIGVNWAPFPDGSLQFIFAYNEELRPLAYGRDRSTLGSIRWNLSRRSYLDVTYQRTRSEIVFQTTESRIFSVSVRLFA
jgi:hypothetical protein